MIVLRGCSGCLRADHRDAAGPGYLLLEVMGERRENRIRELGEHDANRGRVGSALGARAVVSQLVNGGQDLAPRVSGDLPDTIKDARDGSGRDAGAVAISAMLVRFSSSTQLSFGCVRTT